MDAMILKMDLWKAYDKVIWVFLRLILLQFGLPFEVVEWIMGCVSSDCFDVFVNGKPTGFFRSEI